MLIATFLVFGGLGLAMRPAKYSAGVQGAYTVKSTGTKTVGVSEKPKLAVTKIEIETTEEEIPFATTQTYDGTLPKDTTVVKVEGHNGKKVVKTEVKTKDGEVNRSLIGETVTVPPVTKVIAIGTKIVASKPKEDKSKCDALDTTCTVSSTTGRTCSEDAARDALGGCKNSSTND